MYADEILKDCIRLLKKINKLLTIFLVVSLIFNIILSLLMISDLKTNDSGKASTSAMTTIERRTDNKWKQCVIWQKSDCRNYQKMALKNSLTACYCPRRKKKYYPTSMLKSSRCGKLEIGADIVKAA